MTRAKGSCLQSRVMRREVVAATDALACAMVAMACLKTRWSVPFDLDDDGEPIEVLDAGVELAAVHQVKR